ncbi:MAG: 4-(cytidine 5'-diphospho)-2-C-methyl-D-erythritol kinase [Halioglobus sp.]|nr:4-(cytidine 5'-diphospho)-2-C-methyl-D-erythritol kinase [Halioglobus sp.]
MRDALTLPAPAKLNLFLHITGRRADGYHELQTVFALLDWGDTLRFRRNDSGAVTLSGDDLGLAPQDNLVVRAARLLQQGSQGVHIEIDKRIPSGGGLGGGSSDAATTLLALNHLWGAGKSAAELAALGAGLGADVPVFLGGHSAWAEGTGERLTPLDLPARWYLVAVPDCHVSTAEIFSHGQLTRNSTPIKMATFFQGHSRNDCQPLVRRLYPEVDKALILLDKFGEARLTGTGACVFVGFPDEAGARAAQGQLPAGLRSFVARCVNRSPALAALTEQTG